MKHVWVGLFATTIISASTMVSVQCSVNNAGVVESKTAQDPRDAIIDCTGGPVLASYAHGWANFGPYAGLVRSDVVAINVVNPDGSTYSAGASATTSYSEKVIIPGTGSGFMKIELAFSGPNLATYTTSFIFGSYSVSRSSSDPFSSLLLTAIVPIQFGVPIFISATATSSIAIPFFGGAGSGDIGFAQLFTLLDNQGRPFQGSQDSSEGLAVMSATTIGSENSIPEPSSILLMCVAVAAMLAGRKPGLTGLSILHEISNKANLRNAVSRI
jgi:hypothetical protein